MQIQSTPFGISKKNWCSKSTIQEVKRDMATRHTGSINFLKDPKQQFSKGQKRGQKLLQEKLQGNQKCIIMDKTYCKLDCLTLPSQQFYTIPKGMKPDILLKAIKIKKSSKKVMVWQVICSCGFKTQPFFMNGNMNSKVYMEECFKKQLMPMIQKHDASLLT